MEQLTRDIGMEPLHADPLERASVQEGFAVMLMGTFGEDMRRPDAYRPAAPSSLRPESKPQHAQAVAQASI